MSRVAAVLAAFLALSAPALAAQNAQRDVGFLNEERAAFGLPAGITENATWSDGCAKHNDYQRQNGGLTHEEDPSKPGYTPEGAEAGRTSILSLGAEWQAMNNPWEDAPIHLVQLFTPSLAHIGIDDSDGYVCATTFPGMDRTPVLMPTVTVYPGDGTTGFPTAETASEGPFVPGDFVGLPEGTTTGRHLFAYLDMPGEQGPASVKVTAASLTGPDGPVEVRWVDNSTDTIGPYLTGGIIIPVAPLRPASEYTASVTVEGPAGGLTKSWRYSTAGDGPKLGTAVSRKHGKQVAFGLTCGSSPCSGKVVLVKRGTGARLGSKLVALAAGATRTFRLAVNARGRRLVKRRGSVRATLRTTLAGTALKRGVTLRRG